jgi:hypothetical protein
MKKPKPFDKYFDKATAKKIRNKKLRKNITDEDCKNYCYHLNGLIESASRNLKDAVILAL